MKKFEKALRWLVVVFLIIILITILVQRVQGIMHPKIFGYGFGVVMSGSMEPNLPVGSFVVIKEQDYYEPGDIITYNYNDEMSITHRLLEINETSVLVQGDANPIPDPEFPREDIIGEVVCFFDIKYVFIGLLIFIGIAAIYMFIPEKKEERQ
jgi:signal peptidase